MKPLWRCLHEGLIDDIKQSMYDSKFWEEFIIRNIYTPAQIDKEILANCKYKLKELRREYKEKYGQYPKPRQLKERK